MKRKLTHQHQQLEQSTSQQAEHQTAREFATVDEMLRHDALHTPVPPSIGARLHESLSQTSSAAAPWWRHLFPK